MIRHLEYQDRVLKLFSEYLEELSAQKERTDQVSTLALQNPALKLTVPDFTAETWTTLRSLVKLPKARSDIPFSPRKDGVGRPVPNVVFKVPTGGGKTFLSICALSRIFTRYLGKNTGFVLWIVPNESIYSQTLRHLKDRQHSYRQSLDRDAAGRVIILEKNSPINAEDVKSNLCVLLLMLQSANRQTNETLKLFQDRGNIHGFIPNEGEQQAHKKLRDAIPNLDLYSALFPMIKDSLGNALRIIRPVVILDEGHRAVSDLAYKTLYNFNPCFVLELTATPKDMIGSTGKETRYSNVLVDITGIELDREGMIKMPINLDPRQGTDWKTTLASAWDRLKILDVEARKLYADKGQYIRPILLIQVERTGDDQRDGAHIHALDAKEWLRTIAGLDDAEIAIKTANTNDLNNPENMDLLSPKNKVRAIITKQALQEGWDCPFAYVLCALAASSNLSGMTQLIGRILRQPNAEKTGIPALDECYVTTHHVETAIVVQAIKEGLEKYGLGELFKEIRTPEPGEPTTGPRKISRRDAFKGTEIFLPLVMTSDKGAIRPIDYESDILFKLDWNAVDLTSLVQKIPDNFQSPERQIQRIHFSDLDAGKELITSEKSGKSSEKLRFDPTYAVRMISDIVTNPWVGWIIVQKLLSGLSAKGIPDSKIGESSGFIMAELRKWLEERQSVMAEELFRSEVASGKIQFQLRIEGPNWRMPIETETFEPANSPQLKSNDGCSLARSLFVPLYANDFNSDEKAVAVYLDAEQSLTWWHRNVARNQYFIQGWRRNRIYPDFIFGFNKEDSNKIVVLEMKGDQLAGNDDTNYKKAVLELMTKSFSWNKDTPLEKVKVLNSRGDSVSCALVLMSEWHVKLPEYFGFLQE